MPPMHLVRTSCVAVALLASLTAQRSLRFFGSGYGDIDRVKIRVDDPSHSLPGPPVDVGATDFTIEFWLNGLAADNSAAPVSCSFNIAWIYGNIVIDRDRYNQDRKFGLSIAGGRVVFGVSGDGTGDRTICGTRNVLDGAWHHIAVQRRRADGWLWLHVDGALEAQADGPNGDVSYPDDGLPGSYCGGPCVASDPFLVIAAEKHDAGPSYPSFRGLLDELRLSRSLRYGALPFAPATVPFATDGDTVGLYHFDEGAGLLAGDSSGTVGGPSHGTLHVGGSPAGPAWSTQTPFAGLACGASVYGPSLGGSNIGSLTTVSSCVVGTTIVMNLAAFTGDSVGLLALANATAQLPLLGVTLLIDPAGLLFTAVALTTAGAASVPLAIAPNPALVGLTFYGQALVFDPGQTLGWAASHGLRIVLCP